MIKEHDRVVLAAPVPPEGLVVGDVGTVVHSYQSCLQLVIWQTLAMVER